MLLSQISKKIIIIRLPLVGNLERVSVSKSNFTLLIEREISTEDGFPYTEILLQPWRVMDGTECKREIHQLSILDRNMRTLQSKVPKADNFIRDFKILPLEIHLSEGINVFSKNLRAKILNVCHCVLAHSMEPKLHDFPTNGGTWRKHEAFCF